MTKRWFTPLVLMAIPIVGCSPSVDEAKPGVPTAVQITGGYGEAGESGVNLRALLDDVLVNTYQHRELSVGKQAAWQILHGALAYQREFLVQHDGREISAVDYLLDGGAMQGWRTQRGIPLDSAGERFGLRILQDAGSKQGQGHPDQWFAVLAQCGLEANQPIVVAGETYTMEDILRQIQWDVPLNSEREYSWTLIGLTTYLPTTARWEASDGEEWSIERLVEIESSQSLDSSACGGTHRLIGIAMALNQHLAQGGKIEGVWQQADAKIQEAIMRARQYQNADGSFSTNYFARAGRSRDLSTNLGTTGHVIEFLTIAMTDEQLEQPWVRQAVTEMCELFQQTEHIPLECGKLYHAAHGLVLYRHRVHGLRSFAKKE